MDGVIGAIPVALDDALHTRKLRRQLEYAQAAVRAAQRPAHPLLLAADLHGEHDALLAYCAKHHPGTLILLGDQCLEQPLKVTYATVFAAGWDIYYILGNHDHLSASRYDHLVGDYPEGDLSLKFIEVNGLRIGGLSGIFRRWAWHPMVDADAEPWFARRQDLVDHLPPSHRWRGGLPLECRDAIFPDDIEDLAGFNLDVLLTHEAPSTSSHGSVALDILADRTGARLLVHGHHHSNYTAETILPSGRTLQVKGLSKRGVWLLDPSSVAGPPPQDDPSLAGQGAKQRLVNPSPMHVAG